MLTIATTDLISEIIIDTPVYFSSTIRKSLTDATVIGVNVTASSLIRKQNHTLEFMKNWCAEKGYTLEDRFPESNSMQIFFNV